MGTLLGSHFQRVRQGVELLLFPLGAVRVTEVQQALVILLQELVELGVFILESRKLIPVLRGTAFVHAAGRRTQPREGDEVGEEAR